jgi:putative colanic acid biosynthesis acetyltransferase WcaF
MTLKCSITSAQLGRSKKVNYVWWEYCVRLVWRIVWISLWRVLNHRFYFLRPCVLKCFGAKVSIKCQFFGSSWVERPHDVSVGDYSSIGPRVHLYNLANIKIGDNTVLSQDVYVCGGTHDFTDPTMPLVKQNVTIGSSVWICAGAFIGPGVTIGDGAVVGARAVVTKDVEPWTVVAGNPARVIKKRVLVDSHLEGHGGEE